MLHLELKRHTEFANFALFVFDFCRVFSPASGHSRADNHHCYVLPIHLFPKRSTQRIENRDYFPRHNGVGGIAIAWIWLQSSPPWITPSPSRCLTGRLAQLYPFFAASEGNIFHFDWSHIYGAHLIMDRQTRPPFDVYQQFFFFHITGIKAL